MGCRNLCCAEVNVELFSQSETRAMESGFAQIKGDIENPRSLYGAKFFDVTEQQHAAVAFRQRGNGAVDDLAQLRTYYIVLGEVRPVGDLNVTMLAGIARGRHEIVQRK